MPNEAKLTNEEAIEIVTKNGATYIAVQGTPDNKKVANMIADDCHANVAHGETQSIIECNSAVEQRFCMSDEGYEIFLMDLEDYKAQLEEEDEE